MKKNANYLVNISNVIDAHNQREEISPKELSNYYGVTPVRFKAIRERMERRLDKEFTGVVPLPVVSIKVLELACEYGLTDPETFLLSYHFTFYGGFDSGWKGFRTVMNNLLTGDDYEDE